MDRSNYLAQLQWAVLQLTLKSGGAVLFADTGAIFDTMFPYAGGFPKINFDLMPHPAEMQGLVN